LTLDDARRPTGRGGWRPGAGRKPGRTKVGHVTRERFAARHPVHVTLRAVEGVALRNEPVLEVVRAAITAGGRRHDFRVVEFNVLGNHIHLIVEAAGQQALTRGMQGLKVRLARRINRLLGRRGTLFAERYHARVLRTPREVRNAIRYVLLNARHHAAERGQRLARHWLDPYSSAPWFDGRYAPLGDETWSAPWLRRLRRLPRPTAPATTWLLTTGWRRSGLLALDEVPGAAPKTRGAG
jgi:REP element-mobilizing transposase RayT